MNRSPVFINDIPGLPISYLDLEKTQNNVFFVGSSASDNGDTTSYGRSPNSPFSTIDYARSQCENNKGDTIYVLPGHSENAISLTGNRTNVKIIGLGVGSNRPTMNFSATNNTITISANNVTIENVLFLSGIDSITKKITLSGDNCILKNCEFKDITDIESIMDILITGNNCKVLNCFKNGYLSGNANNSFITLNGASNTEIKGNRLLTKVVTTVIDMITVASVNTQIEENFFLVSGTTDLSKNIVDTITGSTYSVKNCFDVGAGSMFSGNDLGIGIDDLSTLAGYHTVPSGDSVANLLLRDIAGNKTDTIAGNSTYSKLIQMASNFNYKNPRFLNVSADMSSATWNTVATHEVFTVSGLVKMTILVVIASDITDGASGGTVEFGDEDDTDKYIATTTGTDLDQYDIWHDATPDSKSELISDAIKDIVVYVGDIGYEIGVGALTGGTIDFFCIWEPIKSNGSVVAGDGSAL